MLDVKYEIIDNIATLSRKGNWALELNIVRWNDGEPKFDIRSWNEDHTKCSKGINLTPGEAQVLVAAMQERLER